MEHLRLPGRYHSLRQEIWAAAVAAHLMQAVADLGLVAARRSHVAVHLAPLRVDQVPHPAGWIWLQVVAMWQTPVRVNVVL